MASEGDSEVAVKPRKFTVNPQASNVADVQDVILSDPEEMENKGTRRILRARIVPNVHDPEASIQATIMHQKRHRKDHAWHDADSFNLTKLHAGEEVRLILTARQTRRLYEALSDLYRIPPRGWTKGEKQSVVVFDDSHLPDTEDLLPMILDAISRDGLNLFRYIAEAQPDLVRAAAIMKRHQERTAALQEFETALRENQWTEADWEQFFARNTWIFGLNLAFQFLGTLTTQPTYVVPSVFGSGGQRGDFLMTTEGDARFTVVVDIKKPDALLVQEKPYRRRVYAPGPDLVGGVAQVQSYCSAWELKARSDHREAVELDRRNISALQPKGILIIGHTSQLDDGDKRDSFALFRRNTLNPEIVTYDELLERARFIVNSEAQEIVEVDNSCDDIPFD